MKKALLFLVLVSLSFAQTCLEVCVPRYCQQYRDYTTYLFLFTLVSAIILLAYSYPKASQKAKLLGSALLFFAILAGMIVIFFPELSSFLLGAPETISCDMWTCNCPYS